MDHATDETDNNRRWALVTGASAGIGTEFSRQLAALGYRLVLVARREDKLTALADELRETYATETLVLTSDLSVNGACERISEQLRDKQIDIDFLVNNAGYGLPGSFHVPGWQEHADFIQLMMTAVCELTWRLLPGMQARKRGYIMNLASVAGLVNPSAGHTLYPASKSFLIKFSEALALENERYGVKVCALCPGFTYTEFHDVNGTRKMMNKLPGYLWLKATDVVADALREIQSDRPRTVVVPGWQYKIIVSLFRYLPWLAEMLNRKNARHYRVTD
jgi:short-subunit dehydrogenase